MIAPAIPSNEKERMEAVRALKILDSDPDERFDRLTKFATKLFNVDIALLSIVDEDRQWFKSKAGLTVSETPRSVSFCGHAILNDELFVINDTQFDERFVDNPLVTSSPNIRFYAGYPITVEGGYKIGTFCLIHSEPKVFTEEEQNLFLDLAKVAEREVNALQQSTLDVLTGVSNRDGFISVGKHILSGARENGKSSTLLLLDIDDFDNINSALGRTNADEMLQAFAQQLQSLGRDSDLVARLHAVTFAVLLNDVELDYVAQFISKLQKRFVALPQLAGLDVKASFSFGYKIAPPTDSILIEDLIDDAESHLNSRKGKK